MSDTTLFMIGVAVFGLSIAATLVVSIGPSMERPDVDSKAASSGDSISR